MHEHARRSVSYQIEILQTLVSRARVFYCRSVALVGYTATGLIMAVRLRWRSARIFSRYLSRRRGTEEFRCLRSPARPLAHCVTVNSSRLYEQPRNRVPSPPPPIRRHATLNRRTLARSRVYPDTEGASNPSTLSPSLFLSAGRTRRGNKRHARVAFYSHRVLFPPISSTLHVHARV